ncbi:MAG: hypothetical protein AB4080_01670 [Trichodesmium sp.]
MVAIAQIRQDLKKIEVAIQEIAKDFYDTYQNYLDVLGKGVGQQLIFASYHICTQKYPEVFLNLSFSQRQKMQEELREIAKIATQDLQELLDKNPEVRQKLDERLAAELMMSLLHAEDDEKPDIVSKLEEKNKRIEFDSNVLFSAQVSSQNIENDRQEAIEQAEDNLNKTEPEKIINSPERMIDKLGNLDTLISWQENIEKQIPEIFKKLSYQTNCILHKAEILPKKTPEKVLEAITKIQSSDTTNPIAGQPNLLNLLIEAENSEGEKDSQVTRIIAVNLRLSEIEFADVNITAWRNKIRKLLGKLSQLQREYRKKQHELAVIEAESAWRSSWYEG